MEDRERVLACFELFSVFHAPYSIFLKKVCGKTHSFYFCSQSACF